MKMNRIDMMETGRNIANIFKRNGISRTKAADMIGVSPVAVAKWCNGVNMPTIDNFVIIAGMFGVKIDDIICVIQGQLPA